MKCLSAAALVAALLLTSASAAFAAKAVDSDKVAVEVEPVACADDAESAMLSDATMNTRMATAAAKKKDPPWVGGTMPLPPAVKPTNPANDPTPIVTGLTPLLGLTCSLNVMYTDSDIQRPPGTVGTPGSSSGNDPSGWSGTTIDPKAPGGCTCNVVLERMAFVCMNADAKKRKVAHELCHCLQAQRGEQGRFDPVTGKWGTGTSSGNQQEWGADACADDIVNGRPPTTTVVTKVLQVQTPQAQDN